MARAIYNGGDIFLLDDPFSSLDSKMTREIFLSSIFGVLKEKTVILATNRTDFLEKMDRILFLNDRKIHEANQEKKKNWKTKEDNERGEEEKETLEKNIEVFSRDKREKKEEGINKKYKGRWRKRKRKIENKGEMKEEDKKKMKVEEEKRMIVRKEEKKKDDCRVGEKERRMKAKSAVSTFWEYASYGNRKLLFIVILLFLGAERLKVEMIKSLVDTEFNYGLLGWLVTMSVMKNYAFNFHFLKINTKIHDHIIKKIANAEVF